MATAAQRLVTEAALKNLAPTPTVKTSSKRLAISAPEKNADGTYGATVAVELGNTGIRNITALCSNIVSGTVELIRTGQTVQISLNAVKIGAGLGPGSVTILEGTGKTTDPLFSSYRTGFFNDLSAPVVRSNGPDVGRLVMNRNGGLSLFGVTSTDTVFGSITTITDRGWPDSLIGA